MSPDSPDSTPPHRCHTTASRRGVQAGYGRHRQRCAAQRTVAAGGIYAILIAVLQCPAGPLCRQAGRQASMHYWQQYQQGANAAALQRPPCPLRQRIAALSVRETHCTADSACRACLGQSQDPQVAGWSQNPKQPQLQQPSRHLHCLQSRRHACPRQSAAGAAPPHSPALAAQRTQPQGLHKSRSKRRPPRLLPPAAGAPLQSAAAQRRGGTGRSCNTAPPDQTAVAAAGCCCCCCCCCCCHRCRRRRRLCCRRLLPVLPPPASAAAPRPPCPAQTPGAAGPQCYSRRRSSMAGRRAPPAPPPGTAPRGFSAGNSATRSAHLRSAGVSKRGGAKFWRKGRDHHMMAVSPRDNPPVHHTPTCPVDPHPECDRGSHH